MCEVDLQSYLGEDARLQVLGAFLEHEAAKADSPIYSTSLAVVADRTSESHSGVLAVLRKQLTAPHDIGPLLEALSLADRWKLFHAVSCGGLPKCLFNCVGHPERAWVLEPVPLNHLQFESPVGALQAMGEARPTFGQAVDFLQQSDAIDQEPHTTQDPLIGRNLDHDSVLVHDGNGRLLSLAFSCTRAEIDDDHQIPMWVGHLKQVSPEERQAYIEACNGIFRTGA